MVGDHEWGHLQLDATSLFLLMLAQMTASGLRIVFTLDEVNFVQNLVHYISRTYRIADYGIWERGNKMNQGEAELNASSIGMAKAALEALAGFNLFGKEGGQASIVHVISDDIARSRITLEALLPRESISKEVDAALLSITGFPAFAIDKTTLQDLTEQRVIDKLSGNYGCKRFLLDGHQTVLEDHQRLHYDPQELKQFMNIECEWPLFFTYLLLNNLFRGNHSQAQFYREQLENLMIERDGQRLLPELYFVPQDAIAAEKNHPHSQRRFANDNLPLVWAQSLYLLGCLIQDGLLSIEDIDPLQRRKVRREPVNVLQVQMLAADEQVQQQLAALNIPAQTLMELAPLQIRDAAELSAAFTQVGRNDRLGLSGRPLRQLRTLATSKMYTLAGENLVFIPQCLNQKGFYLAMDNRLLIERLQVEFNYLLKHWDLPGKPLIVIPVKQNMLSRENREVLAEFLHNLQSGGQNDLNVHLGKIQDFVSSVCIEKISHLHDFRFSEASWEEEHRPFKDLLPISSDFPCQENFLQENLSLNFYEERDNAHLVQLLTETSAPFQQLEILSTLAQRLDLQAGTGLYTSDGQEARLSDLIEELYERAGDIHLWYVIRRCAALLGKYDINLEQSATEILARQHALTLGRSYSSRATLVKPADSSEILAIIRTYNPNNSEQIIIQELIIYLGMLIKSRPQLFTGMHTVRVGHILQLLIAKFQRDQRCSSADAAFFKLLCLAPSSLSRKLREMLEDYDNSEAQLDSTESLHSGTSGTNLTVARSTAQNDPKAGAALPDWYEWREQQGSVGRDSDRFFDQLWTALHNCRAIMIGDPLNSKNRLESDTLLSQMTQGEMSFKLHVSHVLNKIQNPVYRQLTVETIIAIASFFKQNVSLQIEDTLITDVIINHAVRIAWLQSHPEDVDSYDDHASLAWQIFYQLPPHQVSNAVMDALIYLLSTDQTGVSQ